MKLTRLACLLLTLVIVLPSAGCMSNKPLPTAMPWSAPDMLDITRFALKGKVGFRRGDSGGSAALTWRQENDRYQLSAVGPLGQGATQISGNTHLIRIDNKDGSRESREPEALLAEALGWPVAINSLAFWVRGLPAPGSPAEITSDALGQPIHIQQQDWEIVLDRYRPDADRMLPHRIIATGGNSRITLLIERWEVPKRQNPSPAKK